eukprot:gene23030-30224_t
MDNPADNPKFQAMKARDDPNRYVRHWRFGLPSALPQRPGYCCYATWCCYCASYQLRKQALYGDMTRYTCCNGMFPCSGRCGEKKCPRCCLCVEVTLCFASSVAATRFMIQDELRIKNSKCDNCIIGTMIALEYLACICHIVACITGSGEIQQAAQIIQCIADIVWCSVCGCMQTQHKDELDTRDKNPGAVAPMSPPHPQMITMNQGQAQGYPPQQGPPPGYPQQGPPPGYPQHQGPPPGYPQHQGPPPGYPQHQGPPHGYPQHPQQTPPPGYGGHPPQVYGAPPPNYGAPPPGYGAPPPGYGAPQQAPGMHK